ncbi:MAG: hypothetical protein M0P69_14810 [Bacteroidales bacterium]|nr:hypothetical protein [Bacteroidales bacterium]
MQEIEELGRLQFSIPEISIILGIDELSFTNEMMKARNRGRLMASSEVRKSILKQAIDGSTPAQKQMMDLIEKAEPEKLTDKQIEIMQSVSGVD